MTLEQIRQKMKELQAKTRRAFLGGIAVSLVVIGIGAYGIGWGEGPLVRVVCAILIAWSLAGQYFLNRGMWSAVTPGDEALRTGIESYRSEVERRRNFSRHNLLWSFGPTVFALGTFIFLVLNLGATNRTTPEKGTLVNMIPFLALVVLWIITYLIIRMRDQRDLQREIDELNEIEGANG